jgi:hypothetical protein
MPTPAANSCSLSSEELIARRQELIPGLFRRATAVNDIDNGLQFQFDSSAGLLFDLMNVIERERTCCSFLAFHLIVEPHNGIVTLEVIGPKGTGDMLRAL